MSMQTYMHVDVYSYIRKSLYICTYIYILIYTVYIHIEPLFSSAPFSSSVSEPEHGPFPEYFLAYADLKNETVSKAPSSKRLFSRTQKHEESPL
jgi:hypothetical protein